MSSDLEILKRASVSVLLKLALIGVGLAMIWLDIAVFNTQMLEISFTEITQEIMLFLCAVLFWCCSRVPGQKGFSFLAGGFFACLLMRELDGLFDPISHSAWCWPFTAIALFSLFVGFRPKNRDESLAALARFVRTPAFGSIGTGLGVLVFSRVFGMGSLWHLILNEGYARLAKTTIEEGVELLTYALWFAASIDHFWSLRPVASKVTQQSGSHSFATNQMP